MQRPTWSAFVTLQYLLPQHLLSRIVLQATRWRWRWWKNTLISAFLRNYRVNMQEAQQPNALAYDSFNAFFTRVLRPDARPIDKSAGSLACPVDGTVSEAGHIDNGRLLQAKGHSYSLDALLGGVPELTEQFSDGEFATIYLAPHNYHRIHMPVGGKLLSTRYVPGRLFSVNTITVERVPGLFARNERVICLFDTPAGHCAVILVGALFVGSMSTVWAGDITPDVRRHSHWLAEPALPLQLDKGAELGRFNMGSTVILLFQRGRVRWDAKLRAGAEVRMGMSIGQLAALN
jgi:phosphatidylserine decarboxylase